MTSGTQNNKKLVQNLHKQTQTENKDTQMSKKIGLNDHK